MRYLGYVRQIKAAMRLIEYESHEFFYSPCSSTGYSEKTPNLHNCQNTQR